jgi:hypothetical protein
MKSLFDETTYHDVISRINAIEEHTKPQWGKMNAAQMLAHNVIPVEVVLEKRPPVGKPNFLIKLLFKKMMYNDKLYKKNLPTPRPFRVEGDKDYTAEKSNLVGAVNEVYGLRNKTSWPKHPMFGEFNTQQTGQMLYKHLDHHLRQFGV